MSVCLHVYPIDKLPSDKSILLVEENQNFRLTENLQTGLTICTIVTSLKYFNTAYALKQQVSIIPNMEARLATEEYGTKSVTNKLKPRITLPVVIGHVSVTLLPRNTDRTKRI